MNIKKSAASSDAPESTIRLRPTRREAFEAAKVALEAQGLAMTPFGVEVSERIIAGDITHDEAVAILLEHHRPPSATI